MDAPDRNSLDSLTHDDIEAMVRFYDQAKGYGFVQVVDGSPDAFLPGAVLAQAGIQDIQAGDMLFCSIGSGRESPRVRQVHFIDRNPFGKAASFQVPVRSGHGGDAKVTRTDEGQRRRLQR